MSNEFEVPFEILKKFKFYLYPGSVTSTYDGDYHYINFHQLAQCYGLPLNLCVNAPNLEWRGRSLPDKDPDDVISLGPLNQGNYQETLYKAIDNKLKKQQGKLKWPIFTTELQQEDRETIARLEEMCRSTTKLFDSSNLDSIKTKIKELDKLIKEQKRILD